MLAGPTTHLSCCSYCDCLFYRIIILSALAIGMLVGCAEVIDFFFDWVQLMRVTLFPRRMRLHEEAEPKQDEEEGAAISPGEPKIGGSKSGESKGTAADSSSVALISNESKEP